MNTRRNCLVAVAVAVAAATLLPARAEVSAVVDGFGTYVETVVITGPGPRNLRVWGYSGRKLGYYPLNMTGDSTGDRYPLIAENPMDRNPYLVWTRPVGGDVDLMWSRWTGTAWTGVAPVGVATTAGDDQNPNVAFDGDARPYLVWWRNEGGVGRVYLSIFLQSIWMAEIPVSDEGVDARNPRVSINDDKTIAIDFQTPSGFQSRTVSFDWPVSINDDITPMGRYTISVSANVGNRRR